MSEILFLSHRMPFPPNKGDKIRSYHLLRFLAERHRVHLGTFVDSPEDWAHVGTIQAICGECCFRPLNRRLAALRSLGGLASRKALSLPYYFDRRLYQWVRSIVGTRQLAATIVYSSAMAQYVEEVGGHRIADFVDVDSDKWLQYAAKSNPPKSWLYRREGRRLARFEARIAETFDATFLVSAAEATLLRARVPTAEDRIHHFDNGVDADYFSPHRTYIDPYAPGEKPIVFTGAMDYWPNIDAVKWFAEVVFPSVRARHPDAVFTIVGARPTEAVLNLTAHAGVRVTGAVPDVRPYLAHARVAVAPLRIARGVQNKVLEAMAMGLPVVVSAQALEGIDAHPGVHVLLADDGTEFSSKINTVLSTDTTDRNMQGRSRVLERYAWTKNLEIVEQMIRNVSAPSRVSKRDATTAKPIQIDEIGTTL